MRVFLAIEIPEEIKEKISELFLEKLKIQGIKPVEKENLHITIYFLGEMSESKIEEIKEKLSTLLFEKFEATISGIGCFATRVIFLDVENEKFYELHRKIVELLNLREEKFDAHLTLARNKRLNKEEFERILNKLKKIDFREKFVVSGISLFKSTLTRNGPIYERLFFREFI